MNPRRFFPFAALLALLVFGVAGATPAPRHPLANKDARFARVSADGRYVVFVSLASDLVPGDINYATDVFLYDRETEETTLVSRRADGTQSRYDSDQPAISADGRFIAYVGGEGLLADPAESGLVVLDRQTGELTLASRGWDGFPANRPIWDPSISADGRYVVFVSWADNLVPGDTQTCRGYEGSCADVFLHDRATGQTAIISRNANGVVGNDDSRSAYLSADGRFVAFDSYADNLLKGNPTGPTTTNGESHAYVYDRQTGAMSLISRNTAGEQADKGSFSPSISDDGRLVAFDSLATNLAPTHPDAVNVFLHDRQTGETTLLSARGATPGNGSSVGRLSADGRVVVFTSYASNLDPADANEREDVYARDLETGQITLLSRDPAGAPGDGSSWGATLSGDGRTVAFETLATTIGNVAVDDQIDIALHSRDTGRTTLITARPPSYQGNSESRTASVSADGRYVAFESYASNLVPNDANGLWDIFLYDTYTGRTALVGRGGPATGDSRQPVISAGGGVIAFESPGPTTVSLIFAYDRQTGATTLISQSVEGSAPANGDSQRAAVSADGRYVAFDSFASNLVPGDTNDDRDVFVHDRQTGETVMLPRTPAGGNPDWEAPCCPSFSADGRTVAFVGAVEPDLRLGWFPTPSQTVFVHDRQTGQTTSVPFGPSGVPDGRRSGSATLSADGRTVAYSSDVRDLVPDDSNGVDDVFIYDRQTGVRTLVSRHSSGEQGNAESYDPAISADGRYVTFQSHASNLVAGDGNGAPDVFLHDRQTGATTLVSRGGSGAPLPGSSFEPALTAGGEQVVFWSDAALVPGDVNGLYDVFLYDRPSASIRLVSGLILPGPYRFYTPGVMR